MFFKWQAATALNIDALQLGIAGNATDQLNNSGQPSLAVSVFPQ